MKIIGLDLSITGTGLCCCKESNRFNEKPYMTRQFGTKPEYGHHMERIGFIVNSIKPYLERWKKALRMV